MKTMALNSNGQLTYCTVPPDKRGTGRCNHIDHKKDEESTLQFVKRVEELIMTKEKVESKPVSVPTVNSKGVKLFNRNSLEEVRKTEDEEFAVQAENDMKDYAKYVLTYERDINVLKADKDNYGEDWYRQEYQKLDRIRRDKHNAAIISINVLNKICEEYEIIPFYPGDVKADHRQNVAESIFEYFKYELDYLKNM